MDKAKSGAERRTATRVDTHQHVIFSDQRAVGPLRTGTAVDRSTGGLRIVTAFPEAVGSTIQIELQHSGGGGVTLLEGRVMHVAPAESGLYAMGIRLASKMLRPPAPVRVSGSAASGARAITPARRLDVTVGSAGDTMAAVSGTREAVTFRRVPRRGGAGSWAGLMAILALLVILVFLILEAMKEERRNSAALRGPFEQDPGADSLRLAGIQWDLSAISVPPPQESIPDPRSSRANQRFATNHETIFTRAESSGDSELMLAVDPAYASLHDGQSFPSPASAPAMTLDKFIRQLEYAQDSFTSGDEGLARSLVRRALRDDGGVPDLWREFGEGLLTAFDPVAGTGVGASLEQLLAFEPVPASHAAPGDGVRVEVDAGDHAMRVWRGGALLAEYPVGLGRDGATPKGAFRIATKVSDPAWYPEGGRVVPAGDPANPIGAQWMGLAAGRDPTGVGIHPTAHPASIGEDASRGCVRMRPSDAASLFRLVPVGTPVVIHD